MGHGLLYIEYTDMGHGLLYIEYTDICHGLLYIHIQTWVMVYYRHGPWSI